MKVDPYLGVEYGLSSELIKEMRGRRYKYMSKVVAALGILVGGLAVVFELLVAFGINVTPDQQTAIAAVAGVVLTILGVWFHPSVPVGVSDKKV
jgi:cytochrome c biogenesis protein CcdA